jgi:hypothetical protein
MSICLFAVEDRVREEQQLLALAATERHFARSWLGEEKADLEQDSGAPRRLCFDAFPLV